MWRTRQKSKHWNTLNRTCEVDQEPDWFSLSGGRGLRRLRLHRRRSLDWKPKNSIDRKHKTNTTREDGGLDPQLKAKSTTTFPQEPITDWSLQLSITDLSPHFSEDSQHYCNRWIKHWPVWYKHLKCKNAISDRTQVQVIVHESDWLERLHMRMDAFKDHPDCVHSTNTHGVKTVQLLTSSCFNDFKRMCEVQVFSSSVSDYLNKMLVFNLWTY